MDEMRVRKLHDMATRGALLTDAQQALLQAWYHQQDEEEQTLLSSSAPQSPRNLESLRHEVEAALSQLAEVTEQVRVLIRENELLRQEVAALHQKLEQTMPSRAA